MHGCTINMLVIGFIVSLTQLLLESGPFLQSTNQINKDMKRRSYHHRKEEELLSVYTIQLQMVDNILM